MSTATEAVIKPTATTIRVGAIGLVMLALLVWSVGPLWAQDPPPPSYEMRAYVSATTDSDTRQFNLGSIRAPYVCLHCGYSAYYGEGEQCPNPWGVSGHPNIDLVQVPTRNRVLSSTLQDLGLGARDYDYRDTTGAVVGRAILGKPFHPRDFGNLNRSRVHLRTSDLRTHDNINDDTRLRFFITHPGVTRPAAIQTDLANISSENGTQLFDADSDPEDKDDYITVGLNPYRLDDGDQWLIRLTLTRAGGGAPLEARVQIASLLYGLDLDITDDDVAMGDEGTFYVTNSGAIVLNLDANGFMPHMGGPPPVELTWLFHFTVQSNTRLMPRSSFSELGGVGEPALADADDDLTDWAWDDAFPTEPKECWLVAGTGSAVAGGIADDSEVAHDDIDTVRPYYIPANAVGPGLATVQYANSDGADDLTGDHDTEGDWRFYKGWEWQYDAYREVTNQKAARKQAGDQSFRTPTDDSDTHRQWVQYLAECRFFSSRVEFPAPGETWVHSDGSATPAWPNPAYPRVVVGVVDPDAAQVTGEYGPGTRTPTRYFYLFNRIQATDTIQRCDFCGYIKTIDPDNPDEVDCPYHPTAIYSDVATGAISTHYRTSVDLWRKMMAAGTVEASGGTEPVRHVLPGESLKHHEYYRNVYPAWVNPGSSREQSVHLEIPPYQPPSVPAGAASFENDLSADEGYRGGLIMHGDQLNYPSGSGGALSSGWDGFYRCPDCGQLVRGHNDPDSAHPHGSNPCPGHQVCPFTGIEYPADYDADEDQANNQCGFSRGDLAEISGDDTIQPHHITAEEYNVGDIQVSVARKADMRAMLPAVQIGRLQPGVLTDLPDTNVQDNTGGALAFPSATSPEVALGVANEGNIWSPVRVANVYDPDSGSREMSLPHYSRIEVPPYDNSYGRIAQSTPITRVTMRVFDPVLDPSAEWHISSALPFSVGGIAAFGRLQAGDLDYPVPLGQPAGTYIGKTLYFLDVNGNGALDFRVGGPSGAATNSYSAQFDPLVDYPLEPVYSTLPGDMRVLGSRLPHNDYFSADSSPVPIIDPGNKLQVIWMSNRHSAQAPTGIGNECPPGSDSNDIPSATAPVNLLYATADFAGGGADDPLYRGYFWPLSGGRLLNAQNLTNDAAEGSINSSPWVLGNADNSERWAFWHRRLRHPGGVESTLRFDTSTGAAWTWSGSGDGEWIYSGGLPQENITSFRDDAGDHWLFWHTGSEGKQNLMYRWNYSLGASDTNEGPVPVSNAARTDWRADTFPAIDPLNGGATVRIQKPSQSPFTYTKDPSAFLDPAGRVNLLFSGYVRSEGQADICWTRFDPDGMDGTSTTVPNYGKLAFPKVRAALGPYVYTSSASWTRVPEQFKANGLRQLFTSRHLDWMCRHAGDDDNFAVNPHAPSGGAASLNPAAAGYLWSGEYRDPVFSLALVYDTVGDGNRPRAQMFYVTWDAGQYFRSRGVYRVLPRLYPLSAGDVPPALAVASAGGYTIQDQSGRDVMIEINPATGAVGFSSPLFNVDNPADPLAVFNSDMSLAGVGELTDVVMYGSYYPYVYRVTRSGADDDSPSAFYNAAVDPSALSVFWRRRFPATSSPHFGRTGFMYKTYSSSVRVNRPSVTNIGAGDVVNAYDPSTTIPFVADAGALAAGILTVSEEYVGYTLQVSYTSSDGDTHVEAHQVPGWSVETPVPIRTGGAEGRLMVKPEVYTVPNGSGSNINAVRYWLFWTGLGSVYDLRVLDSASSRAGGDPLIMQSADVYSAVMSPDARPVVRERPLSTVSFDPT